MGNKQFSDSDSFSYVQYGRLIYCDELENKQFSDSGSVSFSGLSIKKSTKELVVQGK
jgi:hypothetical protein